MTQEKREAARAELRAAKAGMDGATKSVGYHIKLAKDQRAAVAKAFKQLRAAEEKQDHIEFAKALRAAVAQALQALRVAEAKPQRTDQQVDETNQRAEAWYAPLAKKRHALQVAEARLRTAEKALRAAASAFCNALSLNAAFANSSLQAHARPMADSFARFAVSAPLARYGLDRRAL